MTRRTERAFADLRRALRLLHWNVMLVEDVVGDEALAECQPHHVYDEAKLTIGPLALDLPDREFRVTMAHELMHLHTRDLEHAHEVLLERNPRLRAEWEQLLDERVEALVDRVANVVVDLLDGGPRR